MKIYLVLVVTTVMASANCLAQRAPQVRPRLSFGQILQREDADNDGKVSKGEFRGPRRLFERLDRNADDTLTKEDFAGRTTSLNGSQRGSGRADDVEVLRDVVFGQGGGRDLTMHIVLPKQKARDSAPVYLWVHGGGWKGGTKDGGVRQVIPLVRKGFVGATIEYRLTGEAPFPAQIDDCKCAVRYLRANANKYNIDPERIAVGGSSAGGHLVALLGTSGGEKDLEGDGGWADESSSVQAVVDLYGPTDFKLFVTTEGYQRHNQDGSPESRLLGGGEVLPQTENIERVNPITYVDPDDPPFLIIHGSNDRTVPPNQSQALHAALQKADVQSELHILDGAGHGGPQFATPAVQQIKERFLLRLSKKNNKGPTADASEQDATTSAKAHEGA